MGPQSSEQAMARLMDILRTDYSFTVKALSVRLELKIDTIAVNLRALEDGGDAKRDGRAGNAILWRKVNTHKTP